MVTPWWTRRASATSTLRSSVPPGQVKGYLRLASRRQEGSHDSEKTSSPGAAYLPTVDGSVRQPIVAWGLDADTSPKEGCQSFQCPGVRLTDAHFKAPLLSPTVSVKGSDGPLSLEESGRPGRIEVAQVEAHNGAIAWSAERFDSFRHSVLSRIDIP